MASSTVGTNQHYVPQALLRGFLADEAREQLCVFDKQNQRAFPTTIRNIAAERDFYTLDGSDALDTAMNRADGLVAPILLHLRQTPNLRRLTEMQLGILAGFTALQMIRTRGALEQQQDMGVQLARRLAEMTPEFAQEIQALRDPTQQREMFLTGIPERTRTYMRHLLTKSTILFQSDGSLPFWISDNPVAKHNTLNPGDGIRGTLGLAVPGIEIYLPISSSLTVGFMCPSIAESHQKLYDDCMAFGFISLRAHEYLRAVQTGQPLVLGHENVRFQNSLQVVNAERFVFSNNEEFRDAREMVDKDAEHTRGPRISVR